MQAPKARPGSLETPKKSSPPKPQIAKKMKSPGTDSNGFSSPNLASKTPKDRSVKVVARRSPRSPVIEVKRLETQLAQVQDELKKATDELNSSESRKRRAQQEADDAKKHLSAMSAKLEETQRQFQEISDNEDSRVLELRKISHDRDREWQSELEAIQKQHSLDSAALISAMNEIQRLTRIADSAHMEIHNLRAELTKSFALVEKLKSQVAESKESEAHALEEVSKAQMQLEAAKMTEETLRAEGAKAKEGYDSLMFELEQSKNQEADFSSNIEVSQLRDALTATETRYEEEYTQHTLQIASAYELVEQTKSQSCQREAELEAKFEAARADYETLKEKVMTEVQNMTEENEKLKSEIKKRETERNEMKDDGLALAEQEALKLQELEGELKRVKVQADQWRKAAEAATTILSAGNNNENFLDYSENFMEKKNGNMLKKIGVLLKKGQK